MIASPNGQKIAYAIPNAQVFGKTFLLDFDASTGIVSNEQILSTGGREYGVSFSPDNSKLYFSTIGFGQVFQYDLNAGNLAAIIASKTFIISNGPDSWRGQQLGPDGKIYLSRTQKRYLSVIEFPDSLCPACDYIDSAVYLGGQLTSFCLPNFIAGFNYSNTTFQCETGVQQPQNSEQAIRVYPNPTRGSITIELPQQLSFNIAISNVPGRKIYNAKNMKGIISIDCSSYCNGVYFIEAINDEVFSFSN